MITLIRKKFDIFVFRVTVGKKSCVGKYFSRKQPQGKKEIRYYQTLQAVGVPTLRMIAHTNRLMLLEDIETSAYRLGTEQDMADSETARLIASWFKQLHGNGKNKVALADLDFLINVQDELRLDNIEHARDKSNSSKNPVWAVIIDHLEDIKSVYMRLCDTMTYNDFWWDNMAVAKDGSSALMFDYNCVYRGYAYSDIRHILSVLSKEAGEAFLEAYGNISPKEKAFEDVFFPLTGLLSAFRAEKLPVWAGTFIDMLESGELMERVNTLLFA